jgi:guanine deaminase
MCLGAIYWAHLDCMYYGNNKHDAAAIGFDDAFIYEELDLKPADRKLKSEVLLPEEAIQAFKDWRRRTRQNIDISIMLFAGVDRQKEFM